MLMYLTNDVPSNAFEHDHQTLHEQYHAIQSEYRVLQQHYRTLNNYFHTLHERSPILQHYDLDWTAYRHMLHDYRQSLQEFRHMVQHFRHIGRTPLPMSSSQSNHNSPIPGDRPLLRTTILLGEANAQNTVLLKECLQQADAHRVFVATTRNEVLCLLQNVHIDILILNDELFPLPGSELSHWLQGMKRLETLPVIILRDCYKPFQPAERSIHLFHCTGKTHHGLDPTAEYALSSNIKRALRVTTQ